MPKFTFFGLTNEPEVASLKRKDYVLRQTIFKELACPHESSSDKKTEGLNKKKSGLSSHFSH